MAPVPAGGAAQPTQDVEGLRHRLAAAPRPDLRVEGVPDPDDDRPELRGTRRKGGALILGCRRDLTEDGPDQPADDATASQHGALSSPLRGCGRIGPGRD